MVTDYIEYANAALAANGKEEYFNLSDEEKTQKTAQMYIDSCAKWREENTMPHLEALGNCEYVGIPGDHLIYEYKPEEVAEEITSFLKKIR